MKLLRCFHESVAIQISFSSEISDNGSRLNQVHPINTQQRYLLKQQLCNSL